MIRTELNLSEFEATKQEHVSEADRQLEVNSYMHALLPPMKVILRPL